MSQTPNQALEEEAEVVAQAQTDVAAPDDSSKEVAAPQSEAIRIGRVVAVSGSQVITLLEMPDRGEQGTEETKLQIGTLIKMETPISTIFGMVSGLSIPIPKQDAGDKELNIIEMELVGETMKKTNGEEPSFQRGVSMFPSLGDSVLTSVCRPSAR